MLRQYIYVSTAPQLGRGEIDSILESCQRNNAARNVTGLLLYNGRNFLQLLEGTGEDLEWVIGRISSDPRHSGISVLADVDCEERSCPDWLMRHIRLVDNLDERRDALSCALPDNLDPQLAKIILNFASLN